MYIWIAGLCTGFIGYLMVNNINLCLLEMQRGGKTRAAAFFVLLVLGFEVLYCLLSLWGMKFLLQYPAWVLATRISAIVFLLIIGSWSLLEKGTEQPDKFRRNVIRRGYWSVLVHPQQIPFWLFWGLLLADKGLLQPRLSDFLQLAAANAVGSFLVLATYWKYGNQLIERFSLRRTFLKNLVGVICLLSAVFLFADIIGF